jgi:hypothetical protein
MSVRTSQREGSQPEKRAGCLRSCLLTTLVLVLLAVASVGGAYFFGRAYLARQLPVWEARYPALGLAVDLLHLRENLAPAEGELTAGSERRAGVDDKSAMPDDLPLYPDPEVETYSVGEEQALGFQRVAGTPQAVRSYLEATMPQHGWALAREQDTTWGHLLVWEKGERTCQTEVVASEAATEIWIRCRS